MALITVQETKDDLLRLLRQHEGTDLYPRIGMLLGILQSPDRSLRGIADELSIPESTLRRWKKIYGEKGLDGLLAFKGRNGKERALVGALSAGWGSGAKEHSFFSPDVVQFMNAFPLTSDTMEWSRLMQELLINTFDEVDFALAVVNLIDTLDFDEEMPAGCYRQIECADMRSGEVFYRNTMTPRDVERPPWKDIVDDFRQLALQEVREKKLPSPRVAKTIGFDYYISRQHRSSHVGSIILLRDVKRGEYPACFIELMNTLYPFFRYQFIHHVNSVHLDQPQFLYLERVIRSLSQTHNLTGREGDILLLLLKGHSYKEIADLLNIAHQTVSWHVHRLYRKLNVSSLSELFACSFGVRLFA